LPEKLNPSSARIRKSRILSLKLTAHIRLNTSKFIINPAEKRDEYIAIIDDQIERLKKIINSNRTKTTLKLRALEVLSELIRTSYTMVREEEIEKTERETETLEEEARRSKTEDSTKQEPDKSA
jgi:hypothetical protein